MDLTDYEISKRCLKYIADSKQHTTIRNQKERAKTYQDFFRGGTHQWTQEEWEVYKSKGITPISINRCKPVLKGLLGMYLQSRQEVGVKPRRGGTATTAQVHKEILKHTQDVSNAEFVYVNVFLRGGIDTEAYLKLRIDKGENVNGQPIIEAKSLWNIDVDRNAIEYDLNKSAAYIIEKDWQSKDEVKALNPDLEEKIQNAIETIDDTAKPEERLAIYASSEGGADEGAYDEDENDQIPDSELVKEYRYLVNHVYWKHIKPALIVADFQKKKTTLITEENQVAKLRRKGKKSVRFRISNYTVKELHETIFLGSVLLEDIKEPLGPGVTDYPIVRYSPIWDAGYPCGALDDITSLNKEENIHRTQMVRILNQTANSGWIVEDDSDVQYMNLLKNFGSVPGIVLPRNKFSGHLEKITPNQLPAGHFTMASQFEQDIKRVSGVDDATQGYETGKNESGRAINLKMQSNRTSNEIMFDNFYHSLAIFGNMLLKVQMANDFYTDDEIKAIVSESSMIDPKLMTQARHRFITRLGADLPNPQMMPPMLPPPPDVTARMNPMQRIQLMQQMQQGVRAAQDYQQAYPQLASTFEEVIKADAIETLLQQLRADKGLYGVKVVISPSSPTERMSQFLQMDALMKNYGGIIPLDIFIDLTDLPQKEEIKARLAAQQQQMASRPAQMRGAA